MKIPAYVKQTMGAEAQPVGIACLITAGSGSGDEEPFARCCRLVCCRKLYLRDGGVEG